MKIKNLLTYFIFPAYKPSTNIKLLTNDKNKITYATLIFLFLGVIYTFSVQIAYMKGIGASVEPFFKIPAKDYYYWQRFFQIPFFFITSILFAGIVRLLSIIFNGNGNFEDHFCVFAIAQTLPMLLTMWIPETIIFVFFDHTDIIPVWLDILRQIAGILWPIVITIIGISIIENIKWYQATIIAIISAIPVVATMVIFIR